MHLILTLSSNFTFGSSHILLPLNRCCPVSILCTYLYCHLILTHSFHIPKSLSILSYNTCFFSPESDWSYFISCKGNLKKMKSNKMNNQIQSIDVHFSSSLKKHKDKLLINSTCTLGLLFCIYHTENSGLVQDTTILCTSLASVSLALQLFSVEVTLFTAVLYSIISS